jgi:hypothetical protein
MKRILIPTERLKAIVELYVVCENPNIKTTDGKVPDIHVVIDCDGAHIMMPNVKGDLDD